MAAPMIVTRGVTIPTYVTRYMTEDLSTMSPEIRVDCKFKRKDKKLILQYAKLLPVKRSTNAGFSEYMRRFEMNRKQNSMQIIRKICKYVVARNILNMSPSDRKIFYKEWNGMSNVVLRRKVNVDYEIPWHKDGLKRSLSPGDTKKIFVVGALHVRIPPSLRGGAFETLVRNRYHKLQVQTGDLITFFDEKLFHRVERVPGQQPPELLSRMGNETFANRSSIFMTFDTNNSRGKFSRGLMETRGNRNYMKTYKQVKQTIDTFLKTLKTKTKGMTGTETLAVRRKLEEKLKLKNSITKQLFENITHAPTKRNKSNATKLFKNMQNSFSRLNSAGNPPPGTLQNARNILFKMNKVVPRKVIRRASKPLGVLKNVKLFKIKKRKA